MYLHAYLLLHIIQICLQVPGTGKAIRYMESVAYFMRHGFTQEVSYSLDN